VRYLLLFFLMGCSSMKYTKTVNFVDIDKFMGKWYVIAGRFTFLEEGAHNAVETYKWNTKEKRIDISFTFNKDSFDGKIKSIPQKGWVYNEKTNAHWKVSPFWPLKLDYLVIALADDYSWTAVGVPSGKYLWIMAKKNQVTDKELEQIVREINSQGYPTKAITKVPHHNN
jgi:apolipoprotein D and lipocalin family protein